MKVRKYSLPFDWIDLSPKAISHLISMPQDNIEGFVSRYLDDVKLQRHTGYDTYFPHDFIEGYDIDELKAKFTRRFKRLFDIFRSPSVDNCVFLTVFSYTNEETVAQYDKLLKKVWWIANKKCDFISVNLGVQISSPNRLYSHIDINVPFNGEWDEFEISIGEELKNNPTTKHFFNGEQLSGKDTQ